MKSTKQKKGLVLFFYLIAGLAVSAGLTAGLQTWFLDHQQSPGKIWIVLVLAAALLGFFLSGAGQTSCRAAGYLLSIGVFSGLVILLYPLFVEGDLLKIYLFFFGSAIAGEVILLLITWISPPVKIYAGIGGAACTVISGAILWGYTDGNIPAVVCVAVSLAYVYISTLFYLEYEGTEQKGLLEKSGRTLNIVAFFLSAYGRYSYSWRR